MEIILELPSAIPPISNNEIKRLLRYKPKEHDKKKKRFERDAWLVLKSGLRKYKNVPLKPPVSLYIAYFFLDSPGLGRDNDNYAAGSTTWLINILKGEKYGGIGGWDGDDSTKCLDLKTPKLIENSGESKTIIRVVNNEDVQNG